MTEGELREKYIFEADFGDGNGFKRVEFSDDPMSEWSGDPEIWVLDKQKRWEKGGAKALRVIDNASGLVLFQNALSLPIGIPSHAKKVQGSLQFRPSPFDKAIYSNSINVSISPTEITLDFGRQSVEQGKEGPITVAIGLVPVIMTYETAKSLKSILDSVLKAQGKI